MNIGTRSWDQTPAWQTANLKSKDMTVNGVIQPNVPPVFGRAAAVSPAEMVMPMMRDSFTRSQGASGPADKSVGLGQSPFAMKPNKPSVQRQAPAKPPENAKDKPKEKDEEGDGGEEGGEPPVVKRIPGKVLDFSDLIQKMLRKLADFQVQKTLTETMRRIAYEAQNDRQLAQAQQEIQSIKQQEKPVKSFLNKLLAIQGLKLPDQWVLVKAAKPKSKKKRR